MITQHLYSYISQNHSTCLVLHFCFSSGDLLYICISKQSLPLSHDPLHYLCPVPYFYVIDLVRNYAIKIGENNRCHLPQMRLRLRYSRLRIQVIQEQNFPLLLRTNYPGNYDPFNSNCKSAEAAHSCSIFWFISHGYLYVFK